MDSVPAKTFHLVNGDSAAGVLAASGRVSPEQILVQHDVLSVGPLSVWNDLDQWRLQRQGFWIPDPETQDYPGFLDMSADLFAHCSQAASADRLILWAGCGLSDQLFLASMPRFLDLAGARDRDIEYVQLDARSPSGQPVNGLPALSPGELAVAPEPAIASDTLKELWRQAWLAVSSPDPHLLVELIERDEPGSARFRSALRLWFRRFPGRSSGLPAWDQALLDQVSLKWQTAHDIVSAVIRAEPYSLDPVGDLYLHRRLLGMADTQQPFPLLEARGDNNDLRHSSCRVTRPGVEVQQERCAASDLNPVNDVIGGVRLSSDRQRVWTSSNRLDHLHRESVFIRPAVPGDATAISELMLSLSEGFFANPGGKRDAAVFLETLTAPATDKRLQDSHYDYLVAEQGNCLLGVVAMRERSHLYHLFVAAAEQSQGLGRRLWRAAKSRMVAGGYNGPFTVRSSLPAIGVYERFGFQVEGEACSANGVTWQSMRLLP